MEIIQIFYNEFTIINFFSHVLFYIDVVVKYNKTEFDHRVQIDENNKREDPNIKEKLIARGDKGQMWIKKKFLVAKNGQKFFQVLIR